MFYFISAKRNGAELNEEILSKYKRGKAGIKKAKEYSLSRCTVGKRCLAHLERTKSDKHGYLITIKAFVDTNLSFCYFVSYTPYTRHVACPCSSAVERFLGKEEAGSPILPGG